MLRVVPLIVAICVAAVSSSGARAQQATPPTLTGEEFFGTGTISGQCSPTQPTTHSFTASGSAVGPYPGTFEESGTFTIGPAPSGFGALTDLSATFRIESPLGIVTGTKWLEPLQPPQLGRCVIDNTGSPGNFLVRWEARIEAEGCAYEDRGTGYFSLILDERVLPGENPSFYENFVSELTSPDFLDCVAPPPECDDDDDDEDDDDDDDDDCDDDDEEEE